MGPFCVRSEGRTQNSHEVGAGILIFVRPMKKKEPELRDVIQKIKTCDVRVEQIAIDVGVCSGTIASWVSGRRKPKQATLREIDRVLRSYEG